MQPPFGGANPLFVASGLFERTRAATMWARMSRDAAWQVGRPSALRELGLEPRGIEHGEYRNEATRDLGRHVSALDPLADPSHYGRHRPWDIEGRARKNCAARPRGLPVRDARARRTAIGARHHAARR